MFFYHYKNIIDYNILNKFKFKCSSYLPKLKKISLNFVYSSFDFKELIKSILILELIIPQKTSLRSIFNSKVSLNVKNGFVNSCKLTLINKFIFAIIEVFFYNIFVNNYNFSTTLVKSKYLCVIKTKNLNYFNELKKRYSLINKPVIFKLELLTNSTNCSRLFFLIKSLKLPI